MLDNGTEVFGFDGVEDLAESILNLQPGCAITEEKFSIISLSIPKEIMLQIIFSLHRGRHSSRTTSQNWPDIGTLREQSIFHFLLLRNETNKVHLVLNHLFVIAIQS